MERFLPLAPFIFSDQKIVRIPKSDINTKKSKSVKVPSPLYVCLALYPVNLSYFVSRKIFGSCSMNFNLGVLNPTLFSEIFRSASVLLFQN